MPLRLLSASLALALAAGAAGAVAAPKVFDANITKPEVLAAQEAWCNALVQISTVGAREGQAAARAIAGEVLDTAYGYNLGPVLFKPTLTEAPQTFRTTREGALAYFVGGDPAFPKDDGFALKGWTACTVENVAIHINGDVATTMGNVMITNRNGSVTTVDKTWTFKKTDDGRLRIVLHHSSLPYTSG
ncbi:hypothetical protein [Silanimonas lenta]|uniref:hypothetical protein n=1 Tax=Silanimonas lenta TaxID=265429 RepID=UPI0004057BA6|nr:hypothetical protein [Silanimonas lenta]